MNLTSFDCQSLIPIDEMSDTDAMLEMSTAIARKRAELRRLDDLLAWAETADLGDLEGLQISEWL